MGIVFLWALRVRDWVRFPGMGRGVPRIRWLPSFRSYMGRSGSVMGLVDVLFRMIMMADHPEGSSSNRCGLGELS